MLPTISLFGVSIPLYGLMAALGLLMAVLYLKLLQPQRRQRAADVELLLVWGMVGAFLGAKLLYLIAVEPAFFSDLRSAFSQPMVFFRKYLSGGFVYYGGLFGILAAFFLYCRVEKLPTDEMLMRMLPVVPLIHGLGRVGCFCTGCCYGVATASSCIGVAFHNSAVAPNGVLLVPVQLYEAVCELVLFVVLAVMSARGKSGRLMLGLYLTIYGAVRFLLEFLRGDAYRGFLLGLSLSQFISIIVVATGLAFILYYACEKRRRARCHA